MTNIIFHDYGVIISDKDLGERIYKDLKNVLATEKSVVIDLQDIKSMATFNAKQIFGRLYMELGSSDFYDKVVPELNDLYCYYHRVGNWKILTPKQIIEKKRFLDKEFNVYSHIFKNNILKNYESFIHNCFETFTGWGNDAKIKMNLTKRVDLPDWKSEWNDLFVEEKMETQEKFDKSYFDLMNKIKAELEI